MEGGDALLKATWKARTLKCFFQGKTSRKKIIIFYSVIVVAFLIKFNGNEINQAFLVYSQLLYPDVFHTGGPEDKLMIQLTSCPVSSWITSFPATRDIISCTPHTSKPETKPPAAHLCNLSVFACVSCLGFPLLTHTHARTHTHTHTRLSLRLWTVEFQTCLYPSTSIV